MTCPCCSGTDFTTCCHPFHLKKALPKTAEQLMRLRYCAYAIPNGQYLLDTTFPSMRRHHDARDMAQWGRRNVWIKLEIVDNSSEDVVEFKAYYHDKRGHNIQVHHERSLFKKQDGRWFYHSGLLIH